MEKNHGTWRSSAITMALMSERAKGSAGKPRGKPPAPLPFTYTEYGSSLIHER